MRFARSSALVLAIGFVTATAFSATSVLGHCGSCGSGGDSGGHDHDQKKKNIVKTAASNGDFSTLVKAVEAASLADMLQSEGPFTVIAPRNSAFEALPDGTLQSLLQPANKEKLQAILKYHVVPGKVMAKDALGLEGVKSGTGAAVTTAEGSELSVTVDDGTVMINDAQVTTTDIKASNGVIHVIDRVVLPTSK
jgi:uncharacterized surface protein with fasciclin (FAS1) repeats